MDKMRVLLRGRRGQIAVQIRVGKGVSPEDALAEHRRDDGLRVGDDMDLDFVQERQPLLEIVWIPLILPKRRGGWFLELERPGANYCGFEAIDRVLFQHMLRHDDAPAVGKERQEQTGRSLAVYNDRVRIWRLNPVNEGAKHRSAWAHHALGWVHDALDRIRNIGRGKGRPIVPLDAFVQVERERLPSVTDLPGLGQFGDRDLALGIIRTGTDKAVIGGSGRGVDPAK